MSGANTPCERSQTATLLRSKTGGKAHRAFVFLIKRIGYRNEVGALFGAVNEWVEYPVRAVVNIEKGENLCSRLNIINFLRLQFHF